MLIKQFITFLSLALFLSTSTYAETTMMDDILAYLQANPATKYNRIFVAQDTDLTNVHKAEQVLLEPEAAAFVHEDLINDPYAFPPVASSYFDKQSEQVYLELVHGTHYHYYPFALDSFTEQIPTDLKVKFEDRNWDCPALVAIQFPDAANLAYLALCNN